MPPGLSPPKPTLSDESVRCCRNGVTPEPGAAGREPHPRVLLALETRGFRRVHQLPATRLLGHGSSRAGVHRLARHRGHELLQTVRPADVQPALPHG